jgi:CheY-like chemotaxis protein
MESSGFDNPLALCRRPAYGIHDGAKIVVCSDELARMFGAPGGSSLVGQELRGLFGAASTVAAGPVRSVGVRANGETFPIEFSASLVRFRDGVAHLILIRDLSPVAMVIDDEPSVARTTGSLLRAAGYQTALYTSAIKALADYQPPGASLIVSDVLMPEMDGVALVERIRQIDPGVPVVFVSGYTSRPTPQDAQTQFVQKPFRMRDLSRALARLPERARTLLE